MAEEARLSTVVIAFESEEAARRRLEAFGYAPEIAAEIAVYLAQSTDLPHFAGEIAERSARTASRPSSCRSTNCRSRLRDLAPRRDETIVWALTDGVRFYRGSSVPALARLEGFARFGSPATAAHLAQDKFASLALASAAGLAVPPTRLMEGESEIAALGDWPAARSRCSSSPIRSAPRSGFSPTASARAVAEASRPRPAHPGPLSRPRAHPAVRRRRRRPGELHGLRRRFRRPDRRRAHRQESGERNRRRVSHDEGQ